MKHFLRFSLAALCLPFEKREGAQQGKIPNRISTLRYLLALVMIGFISSIAHAMDAETLRKETGWPNGLVVVFGEPELALDLGKDARLLVLWFHHDPKAVHKVREQILAAGLQGVVTADLCAPGMIPMRGELVNVVAVDPQTAGKATPDEKEIQRVLIPGGSHYRKNGDRWTDRKKAWPKGYGNWTDREQGPHGNPVADDEVATVMRGAQWVGAFAQNGNDVDPLILKDALVMSQTKPHQMKRYGKFMPRDLKPEDLLPEFAERLRAPHPDRTKFTAGTWRGGRDAFNGLPRWVHRYFKDNGTPVQVTLGGGYALYPHIKWSRWGYGLPKGEVRRPIKAIDLRTGAVSHSFDDAPQLTIPWTNKSGRFKHGKLIAPQLAVLKDKVFIAGVGGIAACRLKDGSAIWKIPGETRFMTLPTLSPDGSRLYCFESDTAAMRQRYFGQRNIKALVCIDTGEGKVLWRRPLDVNEASDLVAIDEGVVVGRMSMHGWNIVSGKSKDPKRYGVELINLEGKQVWLTQKADGKAIGQGAQNMLVRDGYVYAAEHYRLIRLDLKTGAAQAIKVPNIGCQRMFATQGQVAFANTVFMQWGEGKDASWTYQGIIHPDCGAGLSIANGRFYARSPSMCDCNFHFRTAISFHSEKPVASVPDAGRLRSGDNGIAPTMTAPAASPASHAQSLIRDEWTIGGYYDPPYGHYGPIAVRKDDTVHGWIAKEAELTYVPKVHGQRLEARQGEQLVWAQQLGGRPAGAPVLAGGHLVQACRDGYVYAFDPASGKPRWRFLAARADQRLVFSGQVESVWPCVGAVLHNNTLVVASGLSGELDGGGMLWGLNPSTANIKWKIPLVTDSIKGRDNDGRARFAGHHQNGWGFPIQGIKVVEGSIALGYRRTANFGSHGDIFWAWVGVDPAKDKSVDLGTRWRGTDRCWFVRDTGKVIPKKSPTKNYINRMKAQ